MATWLSPDQWSAQVSDMQFSGHFLKGPIVPFIPLEMQTWGELFLDMCMWKKENKDRRAKF